MARATGLIPSTNHEVQMIRAIAAAALALVCVASVAEARPRQPAQCIETGTPMRPSCGMGVTPMAASQPGREARQSAGSGMAGYSGSVIGGRPAGCPRAFCGCSASLRVYGRIVPHLNLARNWFSFPRTSPAPGMVAVRRHHVFVLETHVSGSTWISHDGNSGGGKTRLHPRSIAGYAIVNPHASRMASADD